MSDLDILQQIQDVDLSKVPTAFPTLAAGVVQCTIASIEFENRENKKGVTNPWAIVKYTLAQPWKTQPLPDVPVQDIGVGFIITERISLKPWTDPKTNEEKNFGIQRLALLRHAVFGAAAPGTKFFPDELINQPITLKLKFDPAPKNKETGEVYPPQTNVDSYVKSRR
jgi:hypothetical protein